MSWPNPAIGGVSVAAGAYSPEPEAAPALAPAAYAVNRSGALIWIKPALGGAALMSATGYKPPWAALVEAKPSPHQLHALITQPDLLHMT